MKNGVIVYIAGENKQGDWTQLEKILEHSGIKTNRVAVAFEYEDVFDYWRDLTQKGMQSIFCIIGKFDAYCHLSLTPRIMQLRGG
jgi:hypothetical protein